MREILGNAKTVRQLLKDVKYSIDYYQREYKWQEKQVRELIDDLASKFLEEYEPTHPREQVAEYPHYFLGSIIISKKEGANYIVDGQQRLTTLTLLLILLRKLQKDRADKVPVDDLILSVRYGQKSLNLQVDERTKCMEALYNDETFDVTESSESVQNLYKRYQDMEEVFPDELRGHALPYFTDWLLDNVHLVEITTYSDEDAYTVFETMNDRGLSLSPTEMLKGYLLSNIQNSEGRNKANAFWRNRILELNQISKDVDADFFKAWLRSQYAQRIRERKKGAQPEDFERIGTEFHRWLREASTAIGLSQPDDFHRFIERDFRFYSRQYLRLMKASIELTERLEHVYYNAQHGFTLQYMLLLSPLKPVDNENTVLLKLRLVARFVDILLNRRIWNSRSISYSNMRWVVFPIMRDMRALGPVPLAHRLRDVLMSDEETFASNDRLRIHQHNRHALHRLLARLTDYVETESGLPSRYTDFVREGRTRFEIEHIWADRPERHVDEFSHPADFSEYRNRIGGLLLLPRKFNASYGDLEYTEKLKHYNSQNLLARSLHPQCYQHNPGFVEFVKRSGLPFKPYLEFKKADIEERGLLYQKIAERIWNPDDLLREVGE
jgi:hypothetical protein